MRDGKLITITPPSFATDATKQQEPLDQLPFYFPIPPVGDFTRRASAQHTENSVVRRGVVSQFGGPDLEEISWGSEFPVLDWYTNYNPILPNHSVPEMPGHVIMPPTGFKMLNAINSYALLRAIMQSGSVVRLMVEDRPTGRLELDMPVTIRDIEWREAGGEPDTRFYTITFRQYRYNIIRTVDRGGSVNNGNPDRPQPGRLIKSPFTINKTIGIQSLANLAYRDRSKWGQITQANGGSKGMFKRGAQWDPKHKDGPWVLPAKTSYVIPGTFEAGSGIGTVPDGTPPPVGA